MSDTPFDLPAIRAEIARDEPFASIGVDTVLALLDRVEELEEDNAEYVAIFDRTRQILIDTANVLNGPPPPLTTWSHHDLADKAAALTARAEAAEAKAKALIDTAADHDFGRGECVCPLCKAIKALDGDHTKQLGGTPAGEFADVCSCGKSYWPCDSLDGGA